jgi:hypothetical protein
VLSALGQPKAHAIEFPYKTLPVAELASLAPLPVMRAPILFEPILLARRIVLSRIDPYAIDGAADLVLTHHDLAGVVDLDSVAGGDAAMRF